VQLDIFSTQDLEVPSWLLDPQGKLRLVTDTPRARNTDPITSHEAADAIEASGELNRQQRDVLIALCRWPGSTSLELAGRMGVGRQVTGRRLPELAKAEPALARQGDPKKGEFRRINGRRHLQWWPK